MTVQIGRRSYAMLRWLLRVNKPVPPRTEAELEVEAEGNYRWNFVFNLLDGVWFWFGLSFISATTILPLFVSKLTTDPFWFAVLAILGQAAWYLPQLFVAGATERLARKKPIVINLGFFTERLPIWLLPLAALLAVQQPVLSLILFFVGYAWHGFGAGVIAPAWSDLLARCFPIRRRGWFFGFTAFVGTGIGAIGALASGWLLATFPYPVNFAYTFLVAAIAITVSWVFLAFVREPVQPVPEEVRHPNNSSRRKVMAILRGDLNFRRFLGARFLISVSRMGTGFLTVAVIERWTVPDATVGIYTAVLLVGQTAGSLIAGLIADRHGHKLSMELSVWASTFAFGLAWGAVAPSWYYPIFFLTGVATGMTIVSGVLIVLEFSKAEHRPTYIGIGNTVMGIGSALAPLLGAVLASVSYSWLFGLSFVIGVFAIGVTHFWVKEPRLQTEYFEIPIPESA